MWTQSKREWDRIKEMLLKERDTETERLNQKNVIYKAVNIVTNQIYINKNSPVIESENVYIKCDVWGWHEEYMLFI